MTQEQLQQLKETIQKAVPSIMELGFGCEVEFLSNGERDYIAHNKTGYKEYPVSTVMFGSVRLSEIKILGRKITLADVLLAISKSFKNIANRKIIITYSRNGGWVKQVVLRWNLEDDNLDNQSDETKQFLFDLWV